LAKVLPTRNVTAAAAVPTQQMTWVRDPIDRFISGALEIMDRAEMPQFKHRYDPDGRIASYFGQWNESNAGVVLGEFAHYFVRGGAGLKFDGHLKPQFEHLEDMTALKHLGLLSAIFTDLDKNFGTNAAEKSSKTKKGGASKVEASLFKTMRQRSETSWISRALPVPALRELCLFYHADVCCLDRNFSERCASVGVECYANQTYERRTWGGSGMASRGGALWEPSEDAQLKREHSTGVSFERMAVNHSRTERAIRTRLALLMNHPL